MSEPVTNPGPRVRNKLGCLLLVFVGFYLFLFMATGAGAGQLEAGFAILFGWMGFIQRTLPQITFNGDLVVMGCLCALIVLLLAHWCMGWITTSVATARGKTWRWPWKATVCGLIAIALFFVVGMSVGGVVHQVGWISASPGSLYERKGRYAYARSALEELEYQCQQSLQSSSSLQAFRNDLWRLEGSLRSMSGAGNGSLQDYQLLVVVESGEAPGSVIVFPRNPQLLWVIGGGLVGKDETKRFKADELPEILRKYQTNLMAF